MGSREKKTNVEGLVEWWCVCVGGGGDKRGGANARVKMRLKEGEGEGERKRERVCVCERERLKGRSSIHISIVLSFCTPLLTPTQTRISGLDGYSTDDKHFHRFQCKRIGR